MRRETFEDDVGRAFVRAAGTPAHGLTLVVAVSGGPDSIALLSALDVVNRRTGAGWKLHVAHLNHHLRGVASDEDARFVRSAARAMGLTCTIGSARVAAGGRRGTLENAAREARYRFLERVARRRTAKIILVAHHADDQAETVLHHVVRGTGFAGLLGMRESRPVHDGADIRVVRPLLGIRRTAIRAYLRRRGIAFREDATNRQRDRVRNRIRHRILPLLAADLNPRAIEAILRLSQQARWTADFLAETAAAALDSMIVESDATTWRLRASDLARQPRIIQTSILSALLRRMHLGARKIRFEHLSAVADLSRPGRSGRRIEMPGAVAERRGDELCVSPRHHRRRSVRPNSVSAE